MVGKPQDDSLTDLIIRLFESGGHYTTDELTKILHASREEYRFDMLKRHVQQCMSGLKKGTRRVNVPPMDIQKELDEDSVKRWRLIR